MRPLVIIDFSHTSGRMLYTAISQTKPKKKNGKYITSHFLSYYKHLVFNSIQSTKQKFGGDVVLAMDSKGYWRKDFFSEYKGHRAKNKAKSEINFEEYYEEVNKIGDVIKEYFPFKVLKIDKAEADDIAGVLSNAYGNTRQIFLVTSDHDWKQVKAENKLVQMWDPIKREFQHLSGDEGDVLRTDFGNISKFTIKHALLGDVGDNVPCVTDNTVFSNEFISYLKQNEIYTKCPIEFHKMSISSELLNEYNIYKITKSGTNKGKETTEKNIYKNVPFGPKKAEKVTENNKTLNEFLKSNPLYISNFERNLVLVDFDKIPQEIKEDIIDAFNDTPVNYNYNAILKYFVDEGLGQLVLESFKFADSGDNIQRVSNLNDYL